MIIDCPKCGGYGYILAKDGIGGDSCHVCKGTGEVGSTEFILKQEHRIEELETENQKLKYEIERLSSEITTLWKNQIVAEEK